jgi:hypothetical protein
VPFLHRVFDFEDEDDFNVLFFGNTSSIIINSGFALFVFFLILLIL